MKLAFLSGPYRDPRGAWYVLQNVQRARELAVELWQMGLAVICPHSNTALFDGAASDDIWLAGDMEMLSRCDMVVTTPDYETSEGARDEVSKAKELGIPVYHWPKNRGQIATEARLRKRR